MLLHIAYWDSFANARFQLSLNHAWVSFRFQTWVWVSDARGVLPCIPVIWILLRIPLCIVETYRRCTSSILTFSESPAKSTLRICMLLELIWFFSCKYFCTFLLGSALETARVVISNYFAFFFTFICSHCWYFFFSYTLFPLLTMSIYRSFLFILALVSVVYTFWYRDRCHFWLSHMTFVVCKHGLFIHKFKVIFPINILRLLLFLFYISLSWSLIHTSYSWDCILRPIVIYAQMSRYCYQEIEKSHAYIQYFLSLLSWWFLHLILPLMQTYHH